jgi:parvulin-like peptidyl-prolyl isomerase
MLFELAVGEWSNIYEGPSEFQLVRVQNRRPAKQLSFVELEDQIRQELTDERVEKLVKGLYDRAKIETRLEMPEFKCFDRKTVR